MKKIPILFFFFRFSNLFDFFGFFSKLLKLLLTVTEVTNKQQKLPKISKNSIKSLGGSPLQELEECPHSVLYFLVSCKPALLVRKLTHPLKAHTQIRYFQFPISYYWGLGISSLNLHYLTQKSPIQNW